MYKMELTYCNTDRLYYVRLYNRQTNKQLEEAYFRTETAAREFMTRATV